MLLACTTRNTRGGDCFLHRGRCAEALVCSSHSLAATPCLCPRHFHPNTEYHPHHPNLHTLPPQVRPIALVSSSRKAGIDNLQRRIIQAAIGRTDLLPQPGAPVAGRGGGRGAGRGLAPALAGSTPRGRGSAAPRGRGGGRGGGQGYGGRGRGGVAARTARYS